MQVQSKTLSDDMIYADPIDAVRKIVKQDGITGLYTGIFGGLVGVASTNFAYFYWYTFVRDAYKRRSGKEGPLSTAMELLLGAVAGALAQIFTIPVSVCTTRQQTQLGQERKGLIATAKEVISEDGITGLWRGLKPSLVLVVNPAITYGLFERFKEIMYPTANRLTPGQSFMVGAASKTVATIVTYPYIMAKVRMQYKPPTIRNEKVEGGVVTDSHEGSEFDRNDGAVQILKKVYAKSGFLGWYQVKSPRSHSQAFVLRLDTTFFPRLDRSEFYPPFGVPSSCYRFFEFYPRVLSSLFGLPFPCLNYSPPPPETLCFNPSCFLECMQI
jgi:hypothetical protein